MAKAKKGMNWVLALGIVLLAAGTYFFYQTVSFLEKGFLVGSILTTVIGGVVFSAGVSFVRIYIAHNYFKD